MSRVLLIKNANLYDPDPKGIRDILIVDEKSIFCGRTHRSTGTFCSGGSCFCRWKKW